MTTAKSRTLRAGVSSDRALLIILSRVGLSRTVRHTPSLPLYIRASMKLDVSWVAQTKGDHTIVGSDNLMIDAAFENCGYATEHEMPLGSVLHIAKIVDIENVHFLWPRTKMQPSEAKPQRTAKTAALPTAQPT